MEILEQFPQVTILQHLDSRGQLWGTSRRNIVLRDLEGHWRTIAQFPFAMPRDLFGFSRPTARAGRADKANVFVNRAGSVLAIRASVVYRLGPNTLEPLFRIAGDSVLQGSICEDTEGWAYFGEYFMNPSRNPVRIWRLDPALQQREIAHEFAPGTIRHVHGVYRDPFDETVLWVTTGDEDGECYFFRTTDRFGTVEQIGDGSQSWRAVRLFFTSTHVCWLTDSPTEANAAYRMDRETRGVERGMEMDAPFWYGAQTSDDLCVCFSTVEPGEAVRRRQAGIFISRDGFRWEEVGSFQKDRWAPMKLFKYGVISCPSGSMQASSFYLSGEGLQRLDGISLRADLTV